jgi:uncharacterized membrane protein YeiH
MKTEPALLVSLDLGGTFTYAVNGGLTAVRAARLDIVGVVTLAMVSGLGGGIIRDILLGALPPATFSDWRYLAVAAAGGLAAFALSGQLARLATLITVLDAAGLGLFAVTGASKALGLGLGAAPAVILGAITGVGGGTLRDVLLRQIPSVLQRGLYAIPALSAAAITVTAIRAGIYGLPAAAGAVLACFLIRVLGVRYDLNAPMAPEPPQAPAGAGERSRGPGRGSRGFLVSAGILVLPLVIALFVMRSPLRTCPARTRRQPVTQAHRARRKARKPPPARPACPRRQPERVALPRSGEGASRPSARARSTASARVCVPSLAYRWEIWVLTVLCETYSSLPICRIDRLVGR